MSAPSEAPGRIEDAARAAYTSSGGESTIPWERRRLHQQVYWRTVASHAVAAAVDVEVVGAVVARHVPVMRPDLEEIACAGCDYVAEDLTDHGEHVAVWIRGAMFGWPEEGTCERLRQDAELRRDTTALACPRCGTVGRAVLASDAPDEVGAAQRAQWAQAQDHQDALVCDLCGHHW